MLCCLGDLGLFVTGQHFTPAWAVVWCRLTVPDGWCHGCGGHGRLRSSLSNGALRWAVDRLVVSDLSVSRIAAGHSVTWNAANDAVGGRSLAAHGQAWLP